MPLKFPLGQLAATPRALDALNEADVNFLHYLGRYQMEDWGEASPEDADERLLFGFLWFAIENTFIAKF